MRCALCGHWTTSCVNQYENGEELVTYAAPADKGMCSVLNTETPSNFGCVQFEEGSHKEITFKTGEPWQHFVMIPCPDCRGKGSEYAACNRCAGTALVRKYDDGFIGEERTRMHPKEKEINQLPPPPDPGTILKPLPKSDAVL